MSESYIVLPKRSLTEQLGLAEVKPNEARARVMAEASEFAIDAAMILEGRGLHRQEPETPAPSENLYAPLPYIGAVIASFDNRDRAHAAANDLEPYYWFVPDIELSLPGPVPPNVEINTEEVEWPQESGIEEAHSQGVRGQNVLVGILDTGCDADHSEHSGAIRTFRYIPLTVQSPRDVRGFDPSGHGTHVCGVLAGHHIGVAPDVKLWVASVIESEIKGTSLRRIMVGLNWLINIFGLPDHQGLPALINMSLGFLDSQLLPHELNLVRNPLRQIFRTLENLGILTIVAIGNDHAGVMRAPGYFPEAFAVGAVDIKGEPAAFSGGGLSPINSMAKPDIAGYGVDIPSSWERDCHGQSFYRVKSGTSMAAPYVTGIAALYASAYPQLMGNSLKAKLMSTALPLTDSSTRLPYPPDRVGVGLARFM
jgi:serine protease AprX